MPPEDKAADRELAREWETLRNLSKAVREATEKVDADRAANEARIEASVRKLRWFRRVGVIGTVAGVLGVGIGSAGLVEVHTLHEQRDTSRIVACLKANDDAVKLNRLVSADEETLRLAFSGSVDPRASAFLKARIADYEMTRIPKRDCSPAAVARFYTKK